MNVSVLRVNVMNKMFGLALLMISVSTLSGCGTVLKHSPSGNIQDNAPVADVDAMLIPDAVPREEPITIAGNRSPYTVLGKQYEVMPSSSGYEEVGVSSWYGTKFHGRATSNGEIYDLYKMTAAHKTLPIPTYVEVTNLDNGNKVIVRVNDRGPFHSDRIIDLSFVAAKKLGFSDQGTAKVKVKAIDLVVHNQKYTKAQQRAAVEASPDYKLPPNTYLQAGAFSDIDTAKALRDRLRQSLNDKVTMLAPNGLNAKVYRVRIGPLTSKKRVLEITNIVQRDESVTPYLVNDTDL